MNYPRASSWPMRIQITRTVKRMTQQQLADHLGTTRKTIYLWEKGKVKPDRYYRRKLAQWAGVPEETLFKGYWR